MRLMQTYLTLQMIQKEECSKGGPPHSEEAMANILTGGLHYACRAPGNLENRNLCPGQVGLCLAFLPANMRQLHWQGMSMTEEEKQNKTWESRRGLWTLVYIEFLWLVGHRSGQKRHISQCCTWVWFIFINHPGGCVPQVRSMPVRMPLSFCFSFSVWHFFLNK